MKTLGEAGSEATKALDANIKKLLELKNQLADRVKALKNTGKVAESWKFEKALEQVEQQLAETQYGSFLQ